MVKRHIKGVNPTIPIVLDRDGKVSKRYKTKQGKANVVILDGGGRVYYRRAGLYSAQFIREIQENVCI